jgi:ribokinase
MVVVPFAFVGASAFHPTPFSVVAIDKKTGERTGFNGQKQFFELDSTTLKFPTEISGDAFLLDGHNPDASLYFLHLAQKKKIPTFLDLGNPKPAMAEIMKEADYLIIPQTYWREMWPDMTAQEVLKAYSRLSHQTVILTIGSKGCWVGNRETEFYQPPFEAEVIDSNGAGDVFFGAFVYGIVQKWDLRKSIKFASAAGAFACERYGKIEKIPNSVGAINEILEKRVPVTTQA